MSYAGDAPPTALSDWSYEGSTGRTIVDVIIPSSVAPGTKVWLSAFWFNSRNQSGPASSPIETYTLGGLSKAA
jgi:hypothetical protein